MSDSTPSGRTLDLVLAGLPKRRRAEKRFRFYGLASIVLGLFFLVVLFSSIISKGYSAFTYTHIALDISFDPAIINPDGKPAQEAILSADFDPLWKASLTTLFPDVAERTRKKALNGLMSSSASEKIQATLKAHPDWIGTTQKLWLPANDTVDMLIKGHIDQNPDEMSALLKDQIAWIDVLKSQERIHKEFNTVFLTRGDSREPESAGIWGAVKGSGLTLLVTILLSLPIGVAAAVYLEEFAPRNRWTDLIEVNINNLAAVPSIVFGLLGLAVFINLFGIPRSSPLVGGLVLTLMTLPVIIIAGRSALKSVPPSVREAALGVGASPMQMVIDHVLPLAMPGMLTGAIIGLARALGESAPLLMIGMVAFIVDVPGSLTDPATVLPVQIYLWADSPERAFIERTSAAILVLLAFLILMNGIAVYFRKRYERRW